MRGVALHWGPYTGAEFLVLRAARAGSRGLPANFPLVDLRIPRWGSLEEWDSITLTLPSGCSCSWTVEGRYQRAYRAVTCSLIEEVGRL
jgi:hypothetical protein